MGDIDGRSSAGDTPARMSNQQSELKLTDLYEPAEIEKKMLTEEDEVMRIKDIPERFQVCMHACIREHLLMHHLDSRGFAGV